MLRRIQLCRAGLLLLTAILVVAACNPALACESCPQKPRETNHCAGTDVQHNVNHETVALTTEQADQCSHCITHLPSQVSSRAIVLNNPAHGIVAGYPSDIAVPFSAATNAIEIHAHGPPGRSSPRYVLHSSFRI